MSDLLIAVFLDVLIGDPYFFPHPVRLMGNIIKYEERLARKIANSNYGLKFFGGLIVVVNILMAYLIPFYLLKALRGHGIFYHGVNIYLLYTCISAGCLHREAAKIYTSLSKSLEEARHKLSFIVGRDTDNLSKKEIIRATVETVAENTADGVIAPLFYAMIGGAPLALLYKMVNTMDSMLGYINEKYRYFGFFAAKTDDVFNFVPSRITGILMCASSIFKFKSLQGFTIMIRDRRNHSSPNSAYPEAAVAGLLGVQLGGDNSYFGRVMKKPTIGDKSRELDKGDIRKALEIMYRTEILIISVYLVLDLWLGG